jgi:ATP-dependent RNA helicase RhlE
VAEFLTKNGIQAMALHGNKSQGARTQALAGFKSGDIRALVATDIAARGIDIDELPHVVNYEIPNVSEDYVHRIGRTGRAGKSGEAVNLVSLDEEGFMMDIERFTKQQIPVEIFQEFMPEPGERAEPIAMGRQTIWGGAGKPPSRDVMAAAAKAARTEMLQRVREKKASDGGGSGAGQRQRPAAEAVEGNQPRGKGEQQRQAPRGEGRRAGGRNGGGGNRPNPGQPRQTETRAERAPRDDRPPREDRGPREDREPREDRQPGPNAHLGSLRIRDPRPRSAAPGGQPDPLRTSIDSMRSSGNRGKGGPGGNRGSRSGGNGGGGGSGGAADPLRTSFGRIR